MVVPNMNEGFETAVCFCGRLLIDHTLDEASACGVARESPVTLDFICARCHRRMCEHTRTEMLDRDGHHPWVEAQNS